MSKIICDICGTSYPETAESCPICGYSRDFNVDDLLDEEFLLEDEEIITHGKGGKFADANVKKKSRDIFDFDAVNEQLELDEEEVEEEDEPAGDEEEYEEEPKSNTVLVVLLVIIITLLLVATGFLFFRYFMPNLLPEQEESVSPTAATWSPEQDTSGATETTEPEVPCQSLVITSDKAVLNMEGKNWLLHVVVMPEDTTDTLTFVSEDESVATVNDEGRITAVGEGSTNILIICGQQQIKYPVEVAYEEETVADTEVVIPEPTAAETQPAETAAQEETQASEETAPAETTATQAPLKDVVLKLKRVDITLTVGYGVTIELDCDLDPTEVEWSVEHGFIATVDENGFVKAISSGTTAVIAKYGDQEVQCLVRCNPRT